VIDGNDGHDVEDPVNDAEVAAPGTVQALKLLP
jgi:hypothetical protein